MTARVLKVARLADGAVLPTRAHPGDAGLDLYSFEGFELRPGEGRVARTGIAVAVPPGHVGLVADRSSMARAGLKTAGGVIDSGYRGEVGVVLWNLSRKKLRVAGGDRLAQLLIVPVATPAVAERPTLTKTARGAKGFGSSGR